jgi:PAS domain S-box-containing protein
MIEQTPIQEAAVGNRERYALANMAGRVGVWDWNLETHEIYVDPFLKNLLGFEEAEIPDSTEEWMARVHPNDRDKARALFRDCFEGRTDVYELERRMMHKDGSLRWLHSRASVVRGRRGRPVRILGTEIDVTDRKRIEEALDASQAVLRAEHAEAQTLAGRLIAAEEGERRRLARELHDDTSQKLALLLIDIYEVSGMGRSLPGDVVRLLRQISSRAGDIASDLHHLSHELHPSRLESVGLVTALQGLCRDVTAQHRVTVEFQYNDVPGEVQGDVALCLYRIVQEGLHNVVRHSGAAHASVNLEGSDGGLLLRIADQGRGFDPEDVAAESLGLISMRERVNFLGGAFAIHSAPGRGTRIGVRVAMRSSPHTMAIRRSAEAS